MSTNSNKADKSVQGTTPATDAQTNGTTDAQAQEAPQQEAPKIPEIDAKEKVTWTPGMVLICQVLNEPQTAKKNKDGVLRLTADGKKAKAAVIVAVGKFKGMDATHLVEARRLNSWFFRSSCVDQSIEDINKQYGYLLIVDGRGTKARTAYSLTESKYKKHVVPFLQTIDAKEAAMYAGVITAHSDRSGQGEIADAQAKMVIGFKDQATVTKELAEAAKKAEADVKAAAKADEAEEAATIEIPEATVEPAEAEGKAPAKPKNAKK